MLHQVNMTGLLGCLLLSAGALVWPASSPGQTEQNADFVWIFGYYDDGDSSTNFGMSILNFNGSEAPSFYYKPQASGPDFQMYLANSSYCDRDGRLLMYTNGTHIFDPGGHIIPNGDSLSPSFWHWYSGHDAQTVEQGHFFLQMPGHEDTIWLFHQGVDYDERYEFPFIYAPLYYSKIYRLPGTDSLRVVEKNVLLEHRSDFYAPMTACRHANGRDWWIMVSELDSRAKRLYLLSPGGIEYHGQQFTGPAVDAPYDDRTTIRQNVFSPDGRYFARFRYYEQDLNLYRFDRCAGELLYIERIRFPQEEDIYHQNLSFSPNGRFLYASREFYVFQYDLWSDDIPASADTVGVADTSTGPYEYHQLGPDGKIYINAPYDFHGFGNNPYIHVIHAPDEKGDSCRLENNAIILPTDNFHSMPHFPNYRLGPLQGSPCDSLDGSRPPDKRGNWLKLYPNPAVDVLQIELDAVGFRTYELSLYSSDGRLLETHRFTGPAYQLEVGHLPQGMYLVHIFSEESGSHADWFVK